MKTVKTVKTVKETVAVLYAVSTAYAAGSLAGHYAYVKHGYYAAGSEYILILATFYAVYRAVHFIFRISEG